MLRRYIFEKVPDNLNKIAGVIRSLYVYKPLRDDVRYTSIITDIAKKSTSYII